MQRTEESIRCPVYCSPFNSLESESLTEARAGLVAFRFPFLPQHCQVCSSSFNHSWPFMWVLWIWSHIFMHHNTHVDPVSPLSQLHSLENLYSMSDSVLVCHVLPRCGQGEAVRKDVLCRRQGFSAVPVPTVLPFKLREKAEVRNTDSIIHH